MAPYKSYRDLFNSNQEGGGMERRRKLLAAGYSRLFAEREAETGDSNLQYWSAFPGTS